MEKNYLIFDIGVDAKNKMEGLNPLYKRISFSGVKSKEFEKVMTHSSERKLLTDFWELTESKAYILAGFNVIRFDIHYLYIRSLINNVKVPNLKDRILDLRLILSNGNPNFKGKLDEYGALMAFAHLALANQTSVSCGKAMRFRS